MTTPSLHHVAGAMAAPATTHPTQHLQRSALDGTQMLKTAGREVLREIAAENERRLALDQKPLPVGSVTAALTERLSTELALSPAVCAESWAAQMDFMARLAAMQGDFKSVDSMMEKLGKHFGLLNDNASAAHMHFHEASPEQLKEASRDDLEARFAALKAKEASYTAIEAPSSDAEPLSTPTPTQDTQTAETASTALLDPLDEGHLE